MNQRKQELLKVIISQYIKNAQPVGSKLISSAGGFNLSPATMNWKKRVIFFIRIHLPAGYQLKKVMNFLLLIF